LIVPTAVVPDFIQSVGRVDNTSEEAEESGTAQEVLIGFTDDAFEIIEQRLSERQAIGVG